MPKFFGFLKAPKKSRMIEKKFNLDINGNRFTGKVDRIDITDDEYFLIAHRSNIIRDNTMLED